VTVGSSDPIERIIEIATALERRAGLREVAEALRLIAEQLDGFRNPQ